MSHAHVHGLPESTDLCPAFRWAVALNAGFVVVELTAGLMTGSLALLADAAHNLTDVACLLIAWGAAVLANRPPSLRFTYGFGRATIMAALANAIAILIGVGAVLWEAVQRLSQPVEVPGATILLVALVGIGINTGTARLFRKSRHSDLNAEGAFRCWRSRKLKLAGSLSSDFLERMPVRLVVPLTTIGTSAIGEPSDRRAEFRSRIR